MIVATRAPCSDWSG